MTTIAAAVPLAVGSPPVAGLLPAAGSFPAAAAAEPTQLGPLRAALVVVLIAVGSFFLLVGTIGLLRLPDVYNRMHATSKASTLGASSIFLSAVAYFGPQDAGLTALVGIVFLFLTAPTGAHMISRAAQKMGVPFFGDVEWPAGSASEATTDGGATTDDTASDDRHGSERRDDADR